uniref:Uncharacterized protein n=1 Tax=Anopheles dirus TaxID=7168 RepID=A0A182NWB1_9DIPT
MKKSRRKINIPASLIHERGVTH